MSDRRDIDRDSAGGRLPAASGEVDAFLSRVRARPPRPAGRRGRLLFALDATASRQPTWDRAGHLTARMFDAADAVGGLDLRLCYFRGFREFRSSGWHGHAAPLQKAVATVRCAAGHTQLGRVLDFAIEQTRRERLGALVYVGDCFEEDADRVCGRAGELGLLGTPVFVFHEGPDARAAEVFRQIARASGGAFARFDASAADRLEALLRAVAVYAAGGPAALEDLAARDAPARALLEDLRR
ncbi:MAG: VWA domain-containing protein [Pseudomonadales bacterium]|jgi:hypothetical protein|nr:VWA domain-containing protein [Pseudomonadales bacterium]